MASLSSWYRRSLCSLLSWAAFISIVLGGLAIVWALLLPVARDINESLEPPVYAETPPVLGNLR
jgi:hypothetical protein